MSASKFSKEFKEQIVAEVLEGSRPIAEVAKSYNLVPQTVGNWVRIWRKQHPDPGMADASQDQVAENKRLQAELREATTEDRVQRSSGGLHACRKLRVAAKYVYIPP